MAKQNSKTAPATQTAGVQGNGNGFSYKGTLACGTPVTLVHAKRRMYNVQNAQGKILGYVCAKNPVNAINRVEGNTLATLKLH